MRGRSFLVLATAVLVALSLALSPARGRAADPQSAPGHDLQPKAEADAGHAPAAGPEGHGAEGEAKPNPMEIQPTLAIWTVVVFLGLLAVLTKFAWKPLAQALHQREEHLEHCLLQTEKARNESEQLLAEHRRLMAQADERIRALLDKAQKDAEARAGDILKTANAEADASRDRAQRDIATARDQALAEIWSQAANVAVSVAGRVLSRELDENEHRRLIDLAIKELPALTPSTNGHGGAHA